MWFFNLRVITVKYGFMKFNSFYRKHKVCLLECFKYADSKIN
jgi:hypothetical protein